MQLEKIEMSGFKSFADKTVIEFDKGVTAVVGPNGSGKSNLSEAIKWVLGEQSAKSLRGKKMDDVIFAGSQTRKPVNIAEVNLHINNEDGKLAIEHSQVVLTRRLNRNGDSDFFINKKACRLKDITSLMMDSGLGKDSFALISQGKVEQIFNDKPEDRRMIIEEAAGVLKYKDRKTQAQRKLDQTQEHLNRVEDILHEIKSQLTPLLEQKEKAIVYLSKKEELQGIETALLAVEIETLNTQWTVAKREVAQLQETVTKTEQKLVELEQKVFDQQELLAVKNTELDDKQVLYVDAIQKMEQLDGERKVYQQRQEFANRTNEENQLALVEVIRQLESTEQTVAELERAVAIKEVELNEIESLWSKLVEELEQLSQGNEERQKQLQSDYIEQLQEISKLTNQEKHLERSMEQNQNQHDKLLEKQELFEEQSKQLDQKIAQLVEKEENLAQQTNTKQEDLNNYRQQAEILRQERQTMQEQKQKIERQLQQTQANYHSLKQVSEDYAGYYQGVREILKQKKQIAGVIGSVAELIRVDDEVTLAIDIALGASSQHVVVEHEQAAAKAIDYLKMNRLGRATFLPLTIIKEKRMPDAVLQQLLSLQGYVGIASDLVHVEKTYQSIVRNILGTTVVAKTLDDAMKIAKVLQYRYRIVSLEGDVVNAGGSMTGGASKNHQQQSLVKRNSQLETLEQQLKQLKEYENQVSEKWNQLETKWNEIVQKGTAIQEEETVLKQQLQEVRLELQYSKDEFNKISRQTLSQQYELDESIEQYEQLEQQYVETHEALRRITKENQAVKKELDYLQLSQEDRTQQLQEKQQELQEVGTQKARIQEQVQHQKKEFKQEKLSLKRLEEQVHLLESKKDEQKDLKEKNEADYNQTVKDYEAIKETVTALETDLDRLKEERIQLEVLNKQTEVSRNQAQHQLQEYLKQQSKVETKANRFELAIDQKLQYLSEEYELTFEAAIEKTELTMSIEDASKTVRMLKQQIEQMGAVNLMAIEEYDKVQERFEFLTIQQQDLLDAKKNLEDTITEMDTEVTSRFKQTFDAISSQFQQTFPRLFGGGRATLELTDPTNLLETGIEIIAQPPGKKLQSLSLLSGGERAFTAIALLFAILEVKPVPFCLLDEVEAALDEANVARYGRYLKEFTKNTQFIVITHRRGTMEEADVLYGVTMQESGVSKLASVKFEDFDGLE